MEPPAFREIWGAWPYNPHPKGEVSSPEPPPQDTHSPGFFPHRDPQAPLSFCTSGLQHFMMVFAQSIFTVVKVCSSRSCSTFLKGPSHSTPSHPSHTPPGPACATYCLPGKSQACGITLIFTPPIFFEAPLCTESSFKFYKEHQNKIGPAL